jgi:renin receptor
MRPIIVSLAVVAVAAVVSAGDVWILKSPPGFEVDPKHPMKQNDVASFLFRSFGVSETADCSWPGLTQKNPFATSRRAIVVAIPSAYADKESSLDLPGKKIPLTSSFNPEALSYALDHPLSAVFGARAGVEILEQSHIPVVKGVKLPAITLNASLTPVSQFVDELSALAGLPALAFNSQSPARAFVYEFDSLDGLGKREDVFEGRRLVSAVLRSVAEEADATVLVVSYSSSVGKTRTKRQAADAKEGPAADDENDYTVPLNLILWLSLALFFITLAVCIGIGSMDPGWDSIIYRMTNQRMKKDN